VEINRDDDGGTVSHGHVPRLYSKVGGLAGGMPAMLASSSRTALSLTRKRVVSQATDVQVALYSNGASLWWLTVILLH
jgi:hypothetical protein